MNVERRVGSLESVRSFHFDQLHFVVLDPEVKGILQPNI
jgi:hypothetical protein